MNINNISNRLSLKWVYTIQKKKKKFYIDLIVYFSSINIHDDHISVHLILSDVYHNDDDDKEGIE